MLRRPLEPAPDNLATDRLTGVSDLSCRTGVLWSCRGRSARMEVMDMATSKKDAGLASKILSNPKSSKAEKSVAGSDLAQTKSGKK